jgi:hypothetical protein
VRSPAQILNDATNPNQEKKRAHKSLQEKFSAMENMFALTCAAEIDLMQFEMRIYHYPRL